MIRRLDPIIDRDCFVEAWLWEVSAPKWFRDAEKVFGPPTFEDFIESSKEERRATFGVFDPRLIGIVIFTLRYKGMFEVDFMAKSNVSRETLVAELIGLRDVLFVELDAIELFCWTPKKNLPTRRLCSMLGFQDTGLRLIKGAYRNRVIEWYRLSLTREVWEAEMLKAA